MSKPDTSAEAVERLRKAAEGVGAEEWTLYLGDENRIIAVVTYDPQPGRRAHIVSPPIYPKDVKRSETRTRYIAAAHPAAVLALIAERDSLKLALSNLLTVTPVFPAAARHIVGMEDRYNKAIKEAKEVLGL